MVSVSVHSTPVRFFCATESILTLGLSVCLWSAHGDTLMFGLLAQGLDSLGLDSGSGFLSL